MRYVFYINWWLLIFIIFLLVMLKRLKLKLEKIYGVLEFDQSQWLKPHAELSTQKK